MPWFKVDDGLAFHPKAMAAGNAALGLWVRAGSWCMANLTDGFIPASLIGTLNGQRRDALKLVGAGLWMEVTSTRSQHSPNTVRTQTAHETASGNAASKQSHVEILGYQFNGWAEFQPTKTQVEAERKAARLRKQKWREEHGHGVTNGGTDAVTNGGTNTSPTRPDPFNTKATTEVSSSGYEVNAEADETRGPVVDVSMAKLAKTYTDKVKLSDRGKVAAVCLNAIGAGYTQEQIRSGLTVLADEGRTVSANTLRIAIDGEAPNARGRPTESTGTTRSRAALDRAARYAAEDQKQIGAS